MGFEPTTMKNSHAAWPFTVSENVFCSFPGPGNLKLGRHSCICVLLRVASHHVCSQAAPAAGPALWTTQGSVAKWKLPECFANISGANVRVGFVHLQCPCVPGGLR